MVFTLSGQIHKEHIEELEALHRGGSRKTCRIILDLQRYDFN